VPTLDPTAHEDPYRDSGPAPLRVGNVRWTICALLFVATTINYMDRQVLSILKPTLQHSIGLSEQGYGNVIALFQVSYAVGLLLAGRLIDKLGSRLGYSVIMALWSLAALGHALVSTVFGFGVARVLLGLGESGNFPAAIKTVADWFPRRERSLATGIFNAGATAGAIVCPLTIPWITIHYGWHAAFLFTGLLGLPWIIWWGVKYRKPADHPTLSGAELRHIYEESAQQMGPNIPWTRLLTYRQTWGITLGKGLTDPIWWFYLFWIPGFLDSRFHVDLSHLGLPLIVVYTASTIGGILGGWLPNLFEKFGMHGYKARYGAMFVCACFSLPMLFAGGVTNMWLAVGLLSLATAGHQGWSANVYTTASDVFPSSVVGSVIGIAGMAGSVLGTVLSLTAGRILQLTGSYNSLFILAGSVYMVAFICLQIFAPGLKRVNVPTQMERV
jgi:ACS family hexuronate transporter-like MFS transporter